MNNTSDYEKRLEILNRKFFHNPKDKIIDYCLENSKIKNKLQMFSYYQAERILENMATYLLLGQYKENNIMTIFKIRDASIKEIPASCSNSNAEDLMYSNASSQDEDSIVITASTELLVCNAEKPELEMNNFELKNKNKRNKKQIKRYKQTNMYRLEQLHSTRPVKTYRLKQQFNIDENGKRIPLKNVWGQPIWKDEYLTIGGNRGIIPYDRQYEWKWLTVNTDNEFEFKGKKYKIDESVKQYKVGYDNKCNMDKVLCYYIPDENKYYFFDMNIYAIDNKFIKQV